MAVSERAAFLGIDLLKTKDVSIGMIGRYSVSDLDLGMYLPRSVGDGTLYYQHQSYSGTQNNLSKGVYMSFDKVGISAYSDKFDQNIAMQFKTKF
jgi:hypothetical protein